jgi:hypothetical protein
MKLLFEKGQFLISPQATFYADSNFNAPNALMTLPNIDFNCIQHDQQ